MAHRGAGRTYFNSYSFESLRRRRAANLIRKTTLRYDVSFYSRPKLLEKTMAHRGAGALYFNCYSLDKLKKTMSIYHQNHLPSLNYNN